ncbi:uncharacterized protein LOC110818646 isoform X2 [Carica papaya]|uniref:uncharacterized protein LOC110818646 isoform X2 n=1 Tax=Carica papaya TaxID=3649 RepID=UPI000B8CEAC4|nr:uncharacterized protein LOC110818646 isoform X2 [Carica papaya]
MVQAARLSLRMQKELKLLLTDPPPGALFPFLTSDFDVSSLSSIDARSLPFHLNLFSLIIHFLKYIHLIHVHYLLSLHVVFTEIEGPEGTVYANGIFNIKIQIPERYPFQPPIVTFATPIYHPNIDNGGRICLDILNLPPKGAWQPSLNISTVLTSIGLLLSEPNPDDGLMCEASKEYKYNRQVFDQKARSMTEKYAKAGTSGNSGTSSSKSKCIQVNSDTNKGLKSDANFEVNEFVCSHKKPSGFRQKMSLESPTLKQKRETDGQARDVPTDQHFLLDFQNEAEVNHKRKEVEGMHYGCNLSHEKPQGTKRKLSLPCSGQVQKRDLDTENVLNESLPCEPQSIPVAYSGMSTLYESIGHRYQVHQSLANKPVTGGINLNRLLCQSKQKEQVESTDSSKTNSGNNQKTFDGDLLSKNHNVLPSHKDYTDGTGIGSSATKFKEQQLACKKLSLGFKGSSQKQAEDKKENVMPVNELSVSNSQIDSTKVAISRKLSLEPLSQLKGSTDVDHHHNSQLVCHLRSHFMNAAEPLPLPWQSRDAEKQQISQDVAEESMISEAVVVLDSEDSE